MKDARERDLAAYMRTLSPDDIKRENAFRTAQRKLGKSRKSNIKDPNAPKKPLSAYFMFLQRIRANPSLVHDIFGDETETTKQSVLAAAKWRSMSDEERKVLSSRSTQTSYILLTGSIPATVSRSSHKQSKRRWSTKRRVGCMKKARLHHTAPISTSVSSPQLVLCLELSSWSLRARAKALRPMTVPILVGTEIIYDLYFFSLFLLCL